MNKKYIEHLKEHDPIHYCEIMGDPVTGIRTSNESNTILIFLLVIGFCYRSINLITLSL